MGLKAREERAPASDKKTKVPTHRITSPMRNKSDVVYGREKEKHQIMKWVLSLPDHGALGNKVDVIAIVGMGGMGKTTLAQYVYNHPEVEAHFKRSWACISNSFDLVRVNRAILESLTRSPASFCDLAPLHDELEKELRGKRFLLVLDDVWDFSKLNWGKLMAPFSVGASGSKIIVTTRDRRVASAAPADYLFELKPMRKDEGWSLFLSDVFRDGELTQYPKLEVMGKELVKKCGFLPLAIKTLSGLLRSERDEIQWVRILESSFWQLPADRNDIVPAIGLRYSYLPLHLKTCFAYCSLFPKDYHFLSKDLVNMWIDEGFMQLRNDNRSIEDFGMACFEDLLARSFFTVYNDEEYVMHDVIHDLAQTVFADFYQELDGQRAVKNCKKIRHVSFEDSRSCNGSVNVEGLAQIESLQTLIAHTSWPHPKWDLDDNITRNVILEQHSLRVLCLRGTKIRFLPDMGNLKLLRYLDVSSSDVEELSPSLDKLYNLRRLLCDDCDNLEEFTNDLSGLVSLRHFTLSGKKLQNPPPSLSRLVSGCSVKLKFYLPYSAEKLLSLDVVTDSEDTQEGSDCSVYDNMAEIADGSDKEDTESDGGSEYTQEVSDEDVQSFGSDPENVYPIYNSDPCLGVKVFIDRSKFSYSVEDGDVDSSFAAVDQSNVLEFLSLIETWKR